MIRTRPHGVTLIVVAISLGVCLVCAPIIGTWHGWLLVASTTMAFVRLAVPWWRMRPGAEQSDARHQETQRMLVRVVFWACLAIDLTVAVLHRSVFAWGVFIVFVLVYGSLEWTWARPTPTTTGGVDEVDATPGADSEAAEP